MWELAWMVFMWACGAVTGGAIAFRKGAQYERRQIFPNQWKCPVEGCDGEGGSNNPAVLISMIDLHNQIKHSEEMR